MKKSSSVNTRGQSLPHHAVPTISRPVEMRVKGRWVVVPGVEVNGNTLFATGRWLRTASVRGEAMMETDLENPGAYVENLKGDGKAALKADIFTFTQKLPATSPRYAYPLE